MSDAKITGTAPPSAKAGRYRWLIVTMLIVATTVNYVDRTMLGLLAPTLGDELGWTEARKAKERAYFAVEPPVLTGDAA